MYVSVVLTKFRRSTKINVSAGIWGNTMKLFKSIASFLIVLSVAMLIFVSCDKSKAQQADYSAYQGVFYFKDGDDINKDVWFYLKDDGTWQDYKANCGTYTVDNVLDGNIRLVGDLTLSGHIRGSLKLYIDGNEVVYARSADAEIPTPSAEYLCAKYGHDLQSYQAQEPTCLDDGYTAYVACKREGCSYSTKQSVSRLGHSFENGKCVRCGENAPTQEEIAKSEKIKEEIQNDVPDKKPQDIIIPIVPTKEDGATDEQIALAQQQADEAIEEKSYWTIVEIVKNWYAENYANSKEYPNSYVRKIHSIKKTSNNVYLIVDAEIISRDVSGIYKKNYMAIMFEGANTPKNYNNAKELLEFFNGIRDIRVVLKLDAYNEESAIYIFNCCENDKGNKILFASKIIYNKNGNFSEVRLMTYDESKHKTQYIGYDFSLFAEYCSREEIISMAKSGELGNYFISYTYYTSATDLDYDWESANNKYCKS